MSAQILTIAEYLERQRRRLERDEVERRLNRWPRPHQRPSLDEIMGTKPWPPKGGGDAA